MPVLKGTKIGQAVLAALINESILKDPSRTRRIRPDGWMHLGRQTAADLLEVFDNPRACPIQVGAVLKDDVHIRVPEHGLSADSLHMRSSKKAGHDWIRDLIFDDVWRLSHPTRMYDHLNIGDVRQGVEGNVTQRPDTGKRQHENAGENEEPVSGAEINDSGEHVTSPLRH